KAIVQPNRDTLLLVHGGDGIYLDDTQVPSLVRYDLTSNEMTDLGRFIDKDGVPGWIAQCALYSPEDNSVYVGLQQAVGDLRLWKISLSRCDDSEGMQRSIIVPSIHERKVDTFPFGAGIQGADSLPYLREGSVSMVELGWSGEAKVIPAGECAVSDLY